MIDTIAVKNLPDDDLLRRLSELVTRSRRIEAVLVAHIAEVDDRRLYIRDAASMFTHCTQVLHLSEHEAYGRITVARASRKYPALLAMLADGRLHLSGIAKLVPHLTAMNCDDVLARATHKTKSQIEELIAEIAPKPDVPAAVRKLPSRVAETAVDERELGPDRVAMRHDDLLAPATVPSVDAADRARSDDVAHAVVPASSPAGVIAPLAPERYKVAFTASGALRDKLTRLQVLGGCDLATAIEAAVSEKLERLEAKRFGLTKAPRKRLEETDTSASSRHIPAPVRRAVARRDGGQCTFVVRNGGRCAERRGLEFHHRDPYGRGGAHTLDNVCLMCRSHNAYVAEIDYGKERIDRYRLGRDRAPGSLVAGRAEDTRVGR